jgi:lysophospholipid acyltransferase (LPLAT)-like uncharacterized protein
MKIRNPKTLRRVATAAAYVLMGWRHTLSCSGRPLSSYVIGDRPELLGDARFIYVFWHEYLLAPCIYGHADTAVMIGLHRDGELIAQMGKHLGFGVVRGSSTRGGSGALLQMIREETKARHLAITPDGPKGPRRRCQIGAVYLASRTGLPIVAGGFGYSRAWRAKSWDRFAVPMPFSRIRAVGGHPIHVPPDLPAKKLEPYRQQVEDALHQVTAIAEHWAATREFDPLDYVPPPGVLVVPEHLKVWRPRPIRRPVDDNT